MSSGAGIAGPLLAWWDVHGRKDLPWQEDPTPYRVWVSEIMLQQTQVATVERYFPKFMGAFPDVAALAAAEQDNVLHLWSGLGYYARARNLHRSARIVVDEHRGQLPVDIESLTSLPGIGRSTAAAILALSRNERHAILDGNVKRVLARLHAIEEWTGSTAVLKALWQLAERYTPDERPANYTQAIMDLGATVCTRRRPSCDLCPLADGCDARDAGLTERIPAPKPRRERPLRTTAMILVRAGDAVLLEKRPPTGIWGGLWGLPEVPDIDAVDAWCQKAWGASPDSMITRSVIRHGFTHFELDILPVEVRLRNVPAKLMDEGRWLWYNTARPAAVGMAAPVSQLVRQIGVEEIGNEPNG